MPDAVVEIIRIYGPSPAMPPEQDPEIGISTVDEAGTWIGVVDSPVYAGAANIPIPAVGSARSILAQYAMRVAQVASPVTTISNVKAFISQADYNALAGSWDGSQFLTAGPATDPADINPFDTDGVVDDYVQATRTLGPQGYVGNSMVSIYPDVDTPVDMFATLGVGQIDLTGLGREDDTTATFGTSVLDCSRLLLLQISVSASALRGAKPGVMISMSYDEDT